MALDAPLDLPTLPLITSVDHVESTRVYGRRSASLYVKRDDQIRHTVTVDGDPVTVNGSKLAQAFAIIDQEGFRERHGGTVHGGIVGYGGPHSNTAAAMAMAARIHGVACHFHTAEGLDTPELAKAEKLGAIVYRHPAGYLSNIKSRARTDAFHHGWPCGLTHEEAVVVQAAQVQNIVPFVERGEVQRIVVAVGLGVLLTGILVGLRAYSLSVPVLAVLVGGKPDLAFLHRFVRTPSAGVEWERSEVDYSARVPANVGGVLLDPMYEGKLVPYLREGDLLWNSGTRMP